MRPRAHTPLARRSSCGWSRARTGEGQDAKAAFGAAADGETVSVPLASAKSGLYYGIAVARDPSQLDAAAANVSLVRAGDAGATVPVTKPPGGAAFFKVVVSDRAR